MLVFSQDHDTYADKRLFLCFKSFQLIAAGTGKLASIPSGGAPAASSGAAANSSAPAAGAGAKAEKKEEVKEESEDEDMGFGNFISRSN